MGAPIVALGRYYYQLPWPLRDLKRSLAYLEEARRSHPGSLFGRLYLAETYHALDRDDEARQELDFVLQVDPATTEWDEPIRLAHEDRTHWFGSEMLASVDPR